MLAFFKAEGDAEVPHVVHVDIYKRLLGIGAPVRIRKRERVAAGIVTEMGWPEGTAQL